MVMTTSLFVGGNEDKDDNGDNEDDNDDVREGVGRPQYERGDFEAATLEEGSLMNPAADG